MKKRKTLRRKREQIYRLQRKHHAQLRDERPWNETDVEFKARTEK